MTKEAQLQEPLVYFEDFLKLAAKAKQRIWVQAMIFEYGEKSLAIEKVLLQKAQEGLDVRVVCDWIVNKYVHGKFHFIPPFSHKKRSFGSFIHEENGKMYERMRKAGVQVLITNKPNQFQGRVSLLSLLGRNHTKLTLIDDIGWIGGVNIMEPAFKNIDFMVKFSDKEIVKALAYQFPKVDDNKPPQNYSLACGDEYELLIDKGVRGKSIIYTKALQMVENATKEIIFFCQLVPGGPLMKKLIEKSNEGVSVFIVTSPKKHDHFTKYPYKISHFYNLYFIKKKSKITIVHCAKNVHAKLLYTDNKEALFGSNNLAWFGILYGTQEANMWTKDRLLLAQCQKLFMKYVQQK